MEIIFYIEVQNLLTNWKGKIISDIDNFIKLSAPNIYSYIAYTYYLHIFQGVCNSVNANINTNAIVILSKIGRHNYTTYILINYVVLSRGSTIYNQRFKYLFSSVNVDTRANSVKDKSLIDIDSFKSRPYRPVNIS